MLVFPAIPPGSAQRLKERLSPAMADFRIWRGDVNEGKEWDPPLPVLTHVFQRWIIPRGVSLVNAKLDQVLEHNGRWHAQIEARDKDGRFGYYDSRVRYLKADSDWKVDWIGFRGYEPVKMGIERLPERDERMDMEVRLLSSSLYKFTSFWLAPFHQHLVVSSAEGLLPEGEFLTQDELRDQLLKRFGPDYGIGGIQGTEGLGEAVGSA